MMDSQCSLAAWCAVVQPHAPAFLKFPTPTSSPPILKPAIPLGFEPVAIDHRRLIHPRTLEDNLPLSSKTSPSVATLTFHSLSLLLDVSKEDFITSWLSSKPTFERPPSRVIPKAERSQRESRQVTSPPTDDKAFVHLLGWKKQPPQIRNRFSVDRFYTWRSRPSPLAKQCPKRGVKGPQPIKRYSNAPLRPRVLPMAVSKAGIARDDYARLVDKGLREPPRWYAAYKAEQHRMEAINRKRAQYRQALIDRRRQWTKDRLKT